MESKYIDLVINRLTQAQYDELKRNNQISEEEIYNIIDHDDLFYYKTQLYTKEEINALLNGVDERISSLESTVNQTINTEISGINTELSQFKTNVQSTYATKTELADNVNANPGLSGSEDILESIKIDGVNYQVFPEGSIEFNTEKSTDPDAYTLKSITVGTDIWNLPEGGSGTGGGGSSVVANPELSGGEEALESITIDEVNYTLKGEEMVFSDAPVEGANQLRNIQLGDDNWGIPYIDENRITTVENWITDETSGAAAMANQITSLSAEVQLKANTSDVYNKTEVDNLLSNYTPGTGGGSNVTVNQELTGTEEDLVSLTVEGITYSVMGDEITFSEESKSGHSLKSITVGDTVWSIDGSGGDFATEEYVDTRVANLVNSAPSTLDTLGELASALQQNQNVVSALDAAITNKADSTKVYTKEEVNSLISNVGGGSVDKYGSADVSSTTTTLSSSDAGYSMGYTKKLEFTIPDYTSLDDLTEIKIIIKDRHEQYNLIYRYLIFDLVKYTQSGGHSFGFDTAIGRANYWPSNGGNGSQNSTYKEYPTVFLSLNPNNGNVLVYGSTYDLSLEQIKIYR